MYRYFTGRISTATGANFGVTRRHVANFGDSDSHSSGPQRTITDDLRSRC
jgi:hypothetical protein